MERSLPSAWLGCFNIGQALRTSTIRQANSPNWDPAGPTWKRYVRLFKRTHVGIQVQFEARNYPRYDDIE